MPADPPAYPADPPAYPADPPAYPADPPAYPAVTPAYPPVTPAYPADPPAYSSAPAWPPPASWPSSVRRRRADPRCGSAMATASLVLGLVGIVLFWLDGVMPILAIVFGGIS